MSRLIAWVKLVLWNVFAKGPLCLVCFGITSEGISLVIPSAGKKLCKEAGLEFLARFKGWNRLTYAHVAALGLAVCVLVVWSWLMRTLLRPDDTEKGGWDETYLHLVGYILAAVFIVADGFFFYRGITAMGWGEPFSLPALIGTITYTAVVVLVSFVSLLLKVELKEGY